MIGNGAIMIEGTFTSEYCIRINTDLIVDFGIWDFRNKEKEIQAFEETLLKLCNMTKQKFVYLEFKVFDKDDMVYKKTGHELYLDKKGKTFEVRQVIRAGEKQTIYPSLESAILEHIEELTPLARHWGTKTKKKED